MTEPARHSFLLIAALGACLSSGCSPGRIIEAGSASTDSGSDGSSDGSSESDDNSEAGSNDGSDGSDGSENVCGDGMLGDAEDCDDGNDDDTDGCLSTCVRARICSQILDELPTAGDGVYTIDPDGEAGEDPFEAYCDMSQDGGGWTLIAKVHRFHMGEAYAEPSGWFAQERDTDALLDTVSYEDRPAAVASHGEARLAAALLEIGVARFVVIAEDDPDQVATWFKGVDGQAFAWFSDQAHGATPVCSDPELSLDCEDGQILSAGWTPFGAMNLADYGYAGECVVHMRIDSDENGDVYSALCSCTLDNDNNSWNDDAIDGHWGNGLEIWFR